MYRNVYSQVQIFQVGTSYHKQDLSTLSHSGMFQSCDHNSHDYCNYTGFDTGIHNNLRDKLLKEKFFKS